jgi:hypothetical protein
MHYRSNGVEQVVTLEVRDVFLPRSDASTWRIRGVKREFW